MWLGVCENPGDEEPVGLGSMRRFHCKMTPKGSWKRMKM